MLRILIGISGWLRCDCICCCQLTCHTCRYVQCRCRKICRRNGTSDSTGDGLIQVARSTISGESIDQASRRLCRCCRENLFCTITTKNTSVWLVMRGLPNVAFPRLICCEACCTWHDDSPELLDTFANAFAKRFGLCEHLPEYRRESCTTIEDVCVNENFQLARPGFGHSHVLQGFKRVGFFPPVPNTTGRSRTRSSQQQPSLHT